MKSLSNSVLESIMPETLRLLEKLTKWKFKKDFNSKDDKGENYQAYIVDTPWNNEYSEIYWPKDEDTQWAALINDFSQLFVFAYEDGTISFILYDRYLDLENDSSHWDLDDEEIKYKYNITELEELIKKNKVDKKLENLTIALNKYINGDDTYHHTLIHWNIV